MENNKRKSFMKILLSEKRNLLQMNGGKTLRLFPTFSEKNKTIISKCFEGEQNKQANKV